MKKIKVVVIGGGNGSAIVLDGLKKYSDKLDLTAIISVSDSGGSSGKLRREFNTLPPGDIMRAVLALSIYDYKSLRDIFYSPRFSGLGKLDTHNLGNLFLTLTAKYSGDFLTAVEALSQSVMAQGKVYPATLSQVDLVATLDNGKIIRTEAFIDHPNYNRGWKINRVHLEPNCRAYNPAIRAIENADFVLLSPGSLYTSVIAALLPKGIKTALEKSRARLIYIGGAYRKNGETGPEYFSDFLIQLEKYLPRPLDLALFDKFKFNTQQKMCYRQKSWACPVFDSGNLKNRKIIVADYEKPTGGVSSEKLAKILQKILK